MKSCAGKKEGCVAKKIKQTGKQPGAKGFGRSQTLEAEVIIPHYPDLCAACNHDLTESNATRYMGHYVLELKPELFGFGVVTQLHHYYQTTCSCGHCTVAKPGTGRVSVVEDRSYPKRQRCLAHLIRKAIAITGAINQKARKSVAGATRS